MFAQIKDKNAIPLSAKEKSRATTEKPRQKYRKTESGENQYSPKKTI